MLSKSAADCLQMCMRMAAYHPVFQYLSYFNWKRFIQCSNPFKYKNMYFEWFRNFMMQFLSPIWSAIGIPIWRLTMLDMFDGDGAKRAPGDLSGPPWIGLNQTGDFIFGKKKMIRCTRVLKLGQPSKSKYVFYISLGYVSNFLVFFGESTV